MMFSVYKKNRGKDAKGNPKYDRTYTGRYQMDWMPFPKIVALGVTEKILAESILHNIIREEERLQYGAVSRYVKEACSVPISKHLEDFIKVLANIKRSSKHQNHIKRFVTRICDFNGWIYPHEITAFGFEKWRMNSTFSEKTKNHYLSGIHEFCEWMVKHNRMEKNPISAVDKIDMRRVEPQVRHALTAEQVGKLLCVLPEKLRCIVALAVYTGLRRNEIANLKWDYIKTDSGDPVIVVPPSITKNAKKAVLALRQDVYSMLQQYRKNNPELKNGLVFGNFPAFWKIRHYWIAAGIPAHKGSGYDFHSLRKTFCTLLAGTHTTQSIIQHAMRHSSSHLTEYVYTDSANLDIRNAVNALPALIPAENEFDSRVQIGVLDENSSAQKLTQNDDCENLEKTAEITENGMEYKEIEWRRERDSNPRYGINRTTV